jgi:hypothetical protein
VDPSGDSDALADGIGLAPGAALSPEHATAINANRQHRIRVVIVVER